MVGRGGVSGGGRDGRGVSCGEPGIIGMSGPRDMNQAEQTLNLEIRCRHTKATYRGQREKGTYLEVHLRDYNSRPPSPFLPFARREKAGRAGRVEDGG